MATATTVTPASASIELRNGLRCVRLSIELAEPFVGGSISRVVPDMRVELEGCDETSSSYTDANWLSGIASGAFYAFRVLNAPRRVVAVTALSGRLSGGDMQVLAYAAACLVANLLHQDLSLPQVDEWHISTDVHSKNGTKVS